VAASPSPTNFTTFAKGIAGRTQHQCYKRWRNAIDPKIVKEDNVRGRWTQEEDGILRALVAASPSPTNFTTFAKGITGRTQQQCYDRWPMIDPNIVKEDNVRGRWTDEEDGILRALVAASPSPTNFTTFAKGIVGRTQQQCYQHWLTIEPKIVKIRSARGRRSAAGCRP
jgi:hypothetical protein